MIRRLAAALFSACLGMVGPAAAQTVIYPDPPPARADSARPQGAAGGGNTAQRDTVRRDTTRATPAPRAPAPDAILTRVCTDAGPGESAPDVLGIVFQSGAATDARESALAAVDGKRLGGSAEDQFQYVQVPAGGSEFRLRALADKLIRLASVSEVGPVACPAVAAPPPQPAQPAQPTRPDSASS